MRNKFALLIMLFLMISVSQIRHLQNTGTQELNYLIHKSTLSIDDANSPGFIESSISSKVTLDGGSIHTCSIASNGTVLCWGGNTQGQLGKGVSGDSFLPTSVDMPYNKTATKISV